MERLGNLFFIYIAAAKIVLSDEVATNSANVFKLLWKFGVDTHQFIKMLNQVHHRNSFCWRPKNKPVLFKCNWICKLFKANLCSLTNITRNCPKILLTHIDRYYCKYAIMFQQNEKVLHTQQHKTMLQRMEIAQEKKIEMNIIYTIRMKLLCNVYLYSD